jgi:two-component system chemotaxis response regulator CheB
MPEPEPARPRFDGVAIVASAGGLNALGEVLSGLPLEFPAPVVVLLHLNPHHRSHLAAILGRRTCLRVKEAEEGDRLQPGTVYIAPPDRHLLVCPGPKLALTQTAQVHFVRPSADLLFASMAVCFQERALAVVLTGSGMDGADGVRAIKKCGGVVIAQNQATAEYFGMPGAAIESGSVDQVLPLEEIAPTLVALMKRE